MASIPFTLAALATSAVPGLGVIGARVHDDDDESYVSAIIADDKRELLVRIPRTQAAEVQQSAEILGLAALTDGPRALLPFDIPETQGMTRAGETRAVVSTFIDGDRFDADTLAEDALLLQPIAETIAAIHELPRTIAQQGGLPVRSAQDLRLQATRLIDRAEATRMLPRTVLLRWQQVVETAEHWDFAPTMVHGSLDAEQLRVHDDRIVGVVGWSEFSVGDPAADLAWLLNSGSDVFEGVFARYSRLRGTPSITHLRMRAALYFELETARWLLHGVESHDEAIVDDAVRMLDRLVDSFGVLSAAGSLAPSAQTLNEADVSSMLDETPAVVDHLSDTAAYEALDEDRMFGVDTDFIEPLPSADDASATDDGAPDDAAGKVDGAAPVAPEGAERAHTIATEAADMTAGAELDGSTVVTGDANHTVTPTAAASGSDAARDAAAEASDPDLQLTEPISSDDLPERPAH